MNHATAVFKNLAPLFFSLQENLKFSDTYYTKHAASSGRLGPQAGGPVSLVTGPKSIVYGEE